jgi:hypothetical protein
MPLSEAEIRRETLRELSFEKSGFLTLEELVERMARRLPLDDVDRSRTSLWEKDNPETVFSQKVKKLVMGRDGPRGLQGLGFAHYCEVRQGWTLTSSGRDLVTVAA